MARAGWRFDTGGAESAGAGVADWRRGRPAAAPGRGRGWRWHVGVAWFAFLVFCAGFLYVSLWLRPPSPGRLVLLGAGYETNLLVPDNAGGMRTLTQVFAWADRTDSLLHPTKERVAQLRTDVAWEQMLEKVDDHTIVLMISAHGGVDAKGAYLLPTDADLRDDARDDPEHPHRLRLRIEDILVQLEKLPAWQKKLLILDATAMPSQPALGMLTNDFARALGDMEKRIESIPNLAVICAHKEDERSWSSQEWGTTVFGHFLVEGLRGNADQDSDRRVDAWELLKYTTQEVGKWTRINRLAEQTPMLLPRGEEGERRAKHILLSVDRAEDLPPLEKLPEWKQPVQLVDAWKKWRVLAQGVPAPAVVAPYTWQQYQASVLRLEQLLRMSDDAGATAMEAQLDRLERAIAQARAVQPRSLAEYWALAAGPPRDDKLEKAFTELWDATSDDAARKKWNDWRKEAKPDAPMPSAIGLARLLVERVIQQPGELDKAAQRLRLIRSPQTPPTPEAHFLVMLRRDLPGNPPETESAETLPAAVRTRQAAETVSLVPPVVGYSYSEHLQPWLGASWRAIDERRQSAQDRLLSGTPADWKQARADLFAAAEQYRSLHADAALVRRGYATRDRAQAMLPAFGRWIIERPSVDADLDKDVAHAWDVYHQLDESLSRPDAKLNSVVAEQTTELDKTLNQLDGRLDRHLQFLRTKRTIDFADARTVWIEVEAALVVPNKDVDRRIDLIARQHRLSRQLLVDGQSLDAPTPPVGSEKLSKTHAYRVGREVLERLGRRWFDTLGVRGENYDKVEHRLGIFDVEAKWWETAAVAGREIEHRLRGQADDIRRLSHVDPKATWPEQRGAFQKADRIIRLMDSDTPLPADLDPAATYRRTMLGELLLGQAERVWQDHWYDDNPAAEPYYRVVGRGFLAEAEGLTKSLGDSDKYAPGWAKVVAAARQKIQGPGELAIIDTTGRQLDDKGNLLPAPSSAAIVTSEVTEQREYRLQPARADGVVPSGAPVVWVEAFQGLTPLQPAERQRVLSRITAEPGRAELSAPIDFRFASPLVRDVGDRPASAQRSRLTLHGLFRGQPIVLETPVTIHPSPEIIVRQFPPPPRASVAVRSQRTTHTRVASAQGAVAFVLDCSGSMRPRDPNRPDDSRWSLALKAFKAILERLPNDTQISVWVFGAATGVGKTAEQAEQTITPVLPPTLWTTTNSKQRDDIINQLLVLQTLEPWNESPIARTLLAAKGDLAKANGYKAILAITDGGDNRFDKDAELKGRYKTFAGFLKDEFAKSDVALHLVGFPPAIPEEVKAWEEFEMVKSFTNPGKVYSITDVPKVIESFDALVAQRLHYFIDQTGRNVSVDDVPQDGLDVSASGSNYRWIGKGLMPGGHKLRVDAGGRITKNFLLHAGDLLLVDLVETRAGLDFERYLFSNEFPWKRPQDNKRNDWRMTVLQNQLLPSRELEMLVTLEKTVDRRENLLEQIRPREVWVEFDRPQSGVTPMQRWNYLYGYPAPAWSIRAPAWAGEGVPPSRPRVQVWWNPDEEARSAADLDLTPLLTERNRTVFMPGEPAVVIEGVRLEKHIVEVKPGVPEPRMCVVVRLRHSPGRPIVTRLYGVDAAGAEHRLYTAANKVTSLFWFAPDLDDKSAAALSVARLRLISVQAFKDDARGRGYWMEANDLLAPDPADERPRPPIELK
jgi:hypothetical protein